jgi:hypothetical protein
VNGIVTRLKDTIRLIDFKSQPRIIAEIVMLSTADGGRSRGIYIDNEARYMPHLVIDDRSNRNEKTDANGVSTEHYMGVFFEPAEELTDSLTGSGRYPLRLMYHPRVDYNSLVVGTTFTVREGGGIVGHGVVVQRDSVMDCDKANVG